MEFSAVFFWAKGTVIFRTKETERIEPYHLFGSFGCQWAGVWYVLKRNLTELRLVLDILADDLKNNFFGQAPTTKLNSYSPAGLQLCSKTFVNTTDEKRRTLSFLVL